MYLFLISIFCFVRLLLLFHNQDTNSSSAPKQVCRTCRLRILSFPTMHQPVVGSRAKKGASNSQSLEDPLLVVSSSSSSAASIREAVVYGSAAA